MKKVLIVDDSVTVLKVLKNEFDKLDDVEAVYADSYKDAMKKIREHQGKFHAALLDVNLPDAPNGEVISLASSHHIPVIVLTGTISEDVKAIIQKKDICAYILKDSPKSMQQAVKFTQRVLRNYDTTVMVVEDSALVRGMLVTFLKDLNLNVIEAENGQEAFNIFSRAKDKISIVFTDFEMPFMNGVELTIKIREVCDKDQVGIIAISGAETKDIVDEFLKFGANDFLNKPFTRNEIVARLNSNLELLDLFKKMSDMANKDFMTGAYNRRYFFDAGDAIYLKAERKKMPVAVTMIDIDKFKNINDTYGHDVGDIAIKEIKRILDKNLRASDLIARFGGEEFCIVLEDIKEDDVKMLFEKIRKEFEDNVINANGVEIKYTVSFGIAYGLIDSLEAMVKLADSALYVSKENGRNQVTLQHT